jgi:hypothetical protein
MDDDARHEGIDVEEELVRDGGNMGIIEGNKGAWVMFR